MDTTPDHSSFIHDLQIASPCKVDWDSMSGDERKRFCGQCKLNVYNISEMTLPEAEKLVADSEGRVCLRMFRRTDGTVITQDCPVGLAAKLKRRMQRSFAYACAVVTLLVGWAANIRVGDQPSLLERLLNLSTNQPFACATGHASMGKPSAASMPPEMGNVAMPLKPVVTKAPDGPVLHGANAAASPVIPSGRGSHGFEYTKNKDAYQRGVGR